MHLRALWRAALFACVFGTIVAILSLVSAHAAPLYLHGYHHGRHAGNAAHGLARAGVAAMVIRSAEAHRVPPRIALAIVRMESGGRCGAHNRNARGAMQVLRRTAASVGVYGNLLDCSTGIEAGMRYLAMIVHAHGTSCGAISLYNTGAYGRPRCTAYGRRVLSLA